MIPIVDPRLEQYAREHTTPLHPVYDRLRDYTFSSVAMPQMQVGHLEGRLLHTLVGLTAARTVVEVGTYTGYSALSMAEALPEGGRVITHDVNAETTAVARRFWAEAPWGHRIELILGDARQTLPLVPDGVDLAFIDADKEGYIAYWEILVEKLRPGGLIVVDNVLWSGKVLDPQEASDRAIVAFNNHARRDTRVDLVMLTVRDGMTLARKKP